MSRPMKQGLDYFPHDVRLLDDPKLRQPKQKYGYLASMIYIAALEVLYDDKGYYMPYQTEEDKANFHWAIQSKMQGKHQPNTDIIAEVIAELAACGLFAANCLSKIIASKCMQKIYYKITVERKSIIIEPDKWLLSLDEMKKISVKHSYYISLINPPNNEDSRPINEDKPPINTEREANQMKGNQNKGERESTPCTPVELLALFPSLIIDKEITLPLEDFKRMAEEFKKSDFLNETFKSLSIIQKNRDKILAGQYKTFKKASDNKFNTGLISGNLTPEEKEDFDYFRNLTDDEL